GPALREVGEDLGVARLAEGALPERPRLGAGASWRFVSSAFLRRSRLTVRKAARRELIGRDRAALGQEVRQLGREELLCQLDGAGGEPSRLELRRERPLHT